MLVGLQVTLWVTGTLLFLAFRYFQARLGWLWRQKLTKYTHEKYFRDKNYYFIGAGGAGGGQQKMDDADNRIVEDIKKLTQGFAQGVTDIAFNLIAGTVYIYRLWKAYGWIYAVAPFLLR